MATKKLKFKGLDTIGTLLTMFNTDKKGRTFMDNFREEAKRSEPVPVENNAAVGCGMQNNGFGNDPFGGSSFGNDPFGGSSFGNDPFGGSSFGGFGSDPFIGGFGNDPFGGSSFGNDPFGGDPFGGDPFGF